MLNSNHFSKFYFVARKSILLTRMLSTSSQRTDFGFQDVPKEEKETMVKDIFSRVAMKYDIMNDFMSLGAHRIWKDILVTMLGVPLAARCQPKVLPRHLDVAGGTGDIAFRVANEISKAYKPLLASENYFSNIPSDEKDFPVVVCDINPQMLEVGKKRAVSVLKENRSLVCFRYLMYATYILYAYIVYWICICKYTSIKSIWNLISKFYYDM